MYAPIKYDKHVKWLQILGCTKQQDKDNVFFFLQEIQLRNPALNVLYISFILFLFG